MGTWEHGNLGTWVLKNLGTRDFENLGSWDLGNLSNLGTCAFRKFGFWVHTPFKDHFFIICNIGVAMAVTLLPYYHSNALPDFFSLLKVDMYVHRYLHTFINIDSCRLCFSQSKSMCQCQSV